MVVTGVGVGVAGIDEPRVMSHALWWVSLVCFFVIVIVVVVVNGGGGVGFSGFCFVWKVIGGGVGWNPGGFRGGCGCVAAVHEPFVPTHALRVSHVCFRVVVGFSGGSGCVVAAREPCVTTHALRVSHICYRVVVVREVGCGVGWITGGFCGGGGGGRVMAGILAK